MAKEPMANLFEGKIDIQVTKNSGDIKFLILWYFFDSIISSRMENEH